MLNDDCQRSFYKIRYPENAFFHLKYRTTGECMSPRRVMFALLSAIALLLLASAAWGDSHARIVRLSYVEGGVQIDRADGQGFQSAFLNLPITQGVRLETRDDGRAE